VIHPKSSYLVEDNRHLYGLGVPVGGRPTVRVGDKSGTWSAYYAFGGLFTLVAFAWGSPPATLAAPFGTRGEILELCLAGINPINQILPEDSDHVLRS